MAFNPFSLLFKDSANSDSASYNHIPLPESNKTPIENATANISSISPSKYTGISLCNNCVGGIRWLRVGSPTCSPLSTLDAVLSWRPGLDDIAVARCPLRPRTPDPFNQPNVIVCHDMMGGYTKDRFVQVCATPPCNYVNEWIRTCMFCYRATPLPMITISTIGNRSALLYISHIISLLFLLPRGLMQVMGVVMGWAGPTFNLHFLLTSTCTCIYWVRTTCILLIRNSR